MFPAHNSFRNKGRLFQILHPLGTQSAIGIEAYNVPNFILYGTQRQLLSCSQLLNRNTCSCHPLFNHQHFQEHWYWKLSSYVHSSSSISFYFISISFYSNFLLFQLWTFKEHFLVGVPIQLFQFWAELGLRMGAPPIIPHSQQVYSLPTTLDPTPSG